jgi:hypothetical protein
MRKHFEALDDWYISHQRVVRLLMAVLMVVAVYAVTIGISHPALAATTPSPAPLIPPTTPDTSVGGGGTVLGAIIQRVFAGLLFLLGTIAGLGAVMMLILTVMSMIGRKPLAVRNNALYTLGLAAVGGLSFGGAISLINAAAATLNGVVNG